MASGRISEKKKRKDLHHELRDNRTVFYPVVSCVSGCARGSVR